MVNKYILQYLNEELEKNTTDPELDDIVNNTILELLEYVMYVNKANADCDKKKKELKEKINMDFVKVLKTRRFKLEDFQK